ncbi:beta-ketoacyl synthase N-terminal-like domain-containing protein [Frankia sp. QA3]|uniref:beta-ketoacyl synthase N-terminal-like domain-containing protein n=1 Tax=Frankia sp. QA3 TaxID=710111 RepID=UPI000269C570|nr:beta-ketoacyl synthase N-terminal-like domain-containing protein [Frankia sp. QA3]EIV93946.1 3-oxoacyl-(acyl-carrier-protein) synthase [Frankia sp. QA3]
MANDRTVAASGERDVLLTGMGFCLPGLDGPCFTADDVWAVASKGVSCLTRGDIYYGSVALTEKMFDERLPDIPALYRQQLTRSHRLGLISFVQACADGGLDFRAGDLTEAAILTGRGSVDDNVRVYRDLIEARPEELTPDAAVGMFIQTQLGVTPYDVALLQASLARTRGPSFSVTCGCSSSTIQLGNALRMIQAGEVEVAVVTGVDSGNAELARQGQGIFLAAERGGPAGAPGFVPDQLPSTDHPMHPYDERAGSVGFGEGSVTVVLESRAHAERRGARPHGRLLAQATTRDGLFSPLSVDIAGTALVTGVRRCLGERWSIDQIPYINGGSDGDPNVTNVEVNAVRELYGPREPAVLLSSQEACFGHSGAQAGALGAALTTLMIARGEVCPTAGCERPAADLSFDPIPGTSTRPLDFDYALSFTYQIGGLKAVILLGSPDAT